MRMRRISSGKRLMLVGLVLLLGAAVGASSAQQSLITVLSYQDLVRFQIQKAGVEAAQVQIYDLSGNTIYETGWSQGPTLDWPLITQQGQRVANGVFLYVIKTRNAQGQEQQWVGKLAVLDGVLQVGLPPELASSSRGIPGVNTDVVRAQGGPDFGTSTIVGGGLTLNDPDPASGPGPLVALDGSDVGFGSGEISIRDNGTLIGRILASANFGYVGFIGWGTQFRVFTRNAAGTSSVERMRITGDVDRAAVVFQNADVGIGTATPQAVLDIRGSNTNLLRLTNSTSGQSVFRVENNGDVFADGSYNCGLSSGCFNSGQGADVAERIDATEPLDPGDVVEIDPDNPGKFRKAREAMSRRVAGVISTAPAITLGNNFDPEADRWEDNRPLLALAGRVPVKAVAKFGAIEVGDLLVASPIPGYAMKCPEASQCVGAIIGKALEPLKEGVGMIEVQVMLR